MTELENTGATHREFGRRTVLKGAAWSVPVIAAAVATPLAAASVDNASLAWTGATSSLLSLRLLDGTGTLTAQVLVNYPTQLTLQNGPGAISGESAAVTITVGRPGGINLPLGRARGFGVDVFNGVPSDGPERTATYQRAAITNIQYGFPLTTFTRTVTLNAAGSTNLNIPVTWGLAGFSDLLSISALATFPVSASVVIGGRTLTAGSSISVPVGAGIL